MPKRYISTSGIWHTVTDHRQKKRYSRTLDVTVIVPVPNTYTWQTQGRFRYALDQALTEAYPEPYLVACREGAGSTGTGFSVTVQVFKDFPADKPSLIRNEESTERDFLNVRDLQGKCAELSVAIEQGRERAETLDSQRDLAMACLSSLRDDAVDLAKKACRYEQRLAGLRAELEAEYAAQARSDEHQRTLKEWEQDGDGAEVAGVAGLVLEHLEAYCQERPVKHHSVRLGGPWEDSKAGLEFKAKLDEALRKVLKVAS